MSETTNAGETVELPSAGEIEQHMNELEKRGVSIDPECYQCGEPTDLTVLPEEKDDENCTVCRDCAKSRLRDAGLI